MFANAAAEGQHIETTEALLDELGLGEIPRILVFNKIDLIDRGLARRLVLGRRDAAAVEATDRESTRRLLEMIAARLEDRWTQAATVPSFAVAEDEGIEAVVDAAAAAELTTLEQMMGGGRRGKRATARA